MLKLAQFLSPLGALAECHMVHSFSCFDTKCATTCLLTVVTHLFFFYFWIYWQINNQHLSYILWITQCRCCGCDLLWWMTSQFFATLSFSQGHTQFNAQCFSMKNSERPKVVSETVASVFLILFFWLQWGFQSCSQPCLHWRDWNATKGSKWNHLVSNGCAQ